MKKNFWSWLLHDKKRGKNTMCMKLCLCLILVLGGGVFSNTFAQGEKLTLSGKMLRCWILFLPWRSKAV